MRCKVKKLYTFFMKTMKSDVINIVYLSNLYGNLLTDNQKNMLSLFYDADCSLGEIAEQYGISRQAVRDSIVKAESALRAAEEKLGFLKKMQQISNIAKGCKDGLTDGSALVKEALDAIIEITEV